MYLYMYICIRVCMSVCLYNCMYIQLCISSKIDAMPRSLRVLLGNQGESPWSGLHTRALLEAQGSGPEQQDLQAPTNPMMAGRIYDFVGGGHNVGPETLMVGPQKDAGELSPLGEAFWSYPLKEARGPDYQVAK